MQWKPVAVRDLVILFVDPYQRLVRQTGVACPGLSKVKQGVYMRRHRKSLSSGKTDLLVAAVLAVSMTGIVQADHLTTGNDLMQHCMASPDSFCAGYIGGVIDTSHTLFCFPPDITKKQIKNIAILYLRDHPKKLGLYAPNLVIKAMRVAFPCKDGF